MLVCNCRECTICPWSFTWAGPCPTPWWTWAFRAPAMRPSIRSVIIFIDVRHLKRVFFSCHLRFPQNNSQARFKIWTFVCHIEYFAKCSQAMGLKLVFTNTMQALIYHATDWPLLTIVNAVVLYLHWIQESLDCDFNCCTRI